jgi:hypothetical protein
MVTSIDSDLTDGRPPACVSHASRTTQQAGHVALGLGCSMVPSAPSGAPNSHDRTVSLARPAPQSRQSSALDLAPLDDLVGAHADYGEVRREAGRPSTVRRGVTNTAAALPAAITTRQRRVRRGDMVGPPAGGQPPPDTLLGSAPAENAIRAGGGPCLAPRGQTRGPGHQSGSGTRQDDLSNCCVWLI